MFALALFFKLLIGPEESDEESIGSEESVPNMKKVQLEDRVALWWDADQELYFLVRPADGIGMPLEFNDPILHVVGRPDGTSRVIVDSVSQAENIKARWANKILSSQHAEKVAQKGLETCQRFFGTRVKAFFVPQEYKYSHITSYS